MKKQVMIVEVWDNIYESPCNLVEITIKTSDGQEFLLWVEAKDQTGKTISVTPGPMVRIEPA